MADWWIAHVPADNLVAYWDFSDPAIPNTYRDTSATAIVAASLLKLAALLQDQPSAEFYRKHAENTVESLVNEYLTPKGILTQGCYSPKMSLATKNELVWGDYYLFEALNVLDGTVGPLIV
ncbi:MAG: hypothetical protein GIX02_14855 [Candidatus Eremiobacteraeota bacterium]|nr:hypothetical protein [Candidatus Eremiobacteraeota bacterium]